jgi:Mrp family chromosome partitioning ATPase
MRDALRKAERQRKALENAREQATLPKAEAEQREEVAPESKRTLPKPKTEPEQPPEVAAPEPERAPPATKPDPEQHQEVAPEPTPPAMRPEPEQQQEAAPEPERAPPATRPAGQIKGLGSHRVALPEVPAAFAAEVDQFRQGIESALPGPKRRVLMSSATAGEGVTTLTLFVGISLARRAGRSVCVVDANLRSGGLTRWLGLEGQLGVSDVCQGLADWPDALRATDVEGLYVAGTGRAGGEPAVLLGGREGQQMAASLSTRFDFVLIDGGRTLGQVEASLIAPSVDGTVLVVRANHTKREVLAKAEAEIRSHGGRVVGSILNRRTYPIPEAVYRRL